MPTCSAETFGIVVKAAIKATRTEPNIKALSQLTTGGIVNASWVQSSRSLQAILSQTKTTQQPDLLNNALATAAQRMADERDTILADCEQRMDSGQWATWTEDEQNSLLMVVVKAVSGGKYGGTSALLSARVQERALFMVFGTKRCHKTLFNIMGRLEARGCFRIERGNRGYGTRANTSRYHLYTSPSSGERSCVRRPSGQWLKKMEPLFRQLQEALDEAIGYFRSIRSLPEYKNRHIPWEECYYVPEPFVPDVDLDALLTEFDPPSLRQSSTTP